jgi:predicted O-methyltransferase YrrM
MDIISRQAEQYAKAQTSSLDDLLAEIEIYTNINHPHAQMLSGHVQGKILELLSCMLKPKRILEIGTFTGFSALCLAKGLTDDGELHTIEIREQDAATAARFFSRATVKEKIKLHVGNAIDIIPTLQPEWDLVFIDADKTGYIDYYELTLPLLKKGGFIIADNVLFHGEVIKEAITGKNAKAIDAFNKHVAADKRTEKALLTIRDGLLLIKKI